MTAGPETTSAPYNMSKELSLSPYPGIAGGQSVVSGNATSDNGLPPNGAVEFAVRFMTPRRALQTAILSVQCAWLEGLFKTPNAEAVQA